MFRILSQLLFAECDTISHLIIPPLVYEPKEGRFDRVDRQQTWVGDLGRTVVKFKIVSKFIGPVLVDIQRIVYRSSNHILSKSSAYIKKSLTESNLFR